MRIYASTFIQILISKAGLISAQILLDHQQKIYMYYLFIFSNNYFAKKNLYVSFQNRNANTIQAKDPPKNTLIWAENKRSNLLNQWLTGQVSVMQAIDSTYRVELIKSSWYLNAQLFL